MATPDQNWRTTNTPAIVNDHNNVPVYQPNNGAPEVAPSQSYQADLYENWDPNVQDAGQTDIVTYESAGDSDFIYFRFDQRDAVTTNGSVIFHIGIDTDGDGDEDYWLEYNPDSSNIGSGWDNASNISYDLKFDANDDVGGGNTTPDSDDTADGFEDGVDVNDDDIFARIVDGNVEIAVSRNVLGINEAQQVGSRGWTRQDGNIGTDKTHWHDEQESSDLGTFRIDNTAGAGDLLVECFLTGTHILTDRGEVAVETLQIGDKVQTAEGSLEPIKWIGRQTATAEQLKNPLRGLPILIKEGAFGNNLPKRDLYVSPDHAMLVDGLLINAGALVNGVSIVKTEPTEAFTYYHVELDKHALIIAEGAAAESYLPQKEDRYLYDNGAEYEALYPNQSNMILWPLDYPRVSSSTTVPRYIRKNLMAIANQLNYAEALQTV